MDLGLRLVKKHILKFINGGINKLCLMILQNSNRQRRNRTMCDMRPMELNDTVEMMNSEDYKERFKAEYYQTVIRYGKLKNMLDRWDIVPV